MPHQEAPNQAQYHNQQLFTAAPAISSSGQGFNVSVDFRKFAITQHRSRSTSLMWAIGWGWIFLCWLYLLLIMLTSSGDESSSRSSRSSGFGMLDSYSEEVDQMAAIIGALGFASINTVAMVVFLQLLWTIRYLVGKRRNNDHSAPAA